MLSGYYQAWLDGLLARHPEIEAAVVVGADGKSLAHANLGNAEETFISGITFAIFGASDTMASDLWHSFARHVQLQFEEGCLIIFSLAPDALLAVIYKKGCHPRYLGTPECITN